MQISFVDLRHKTHDIQSALGRSEEITLTYRGKPKAKIVPIRTESKKKIEDHVSSVDQVNSNFKSLKDSVLASVAEANRYVDTQIRNGISSIPKPVIPSLDDAAKQFQTKLEPVTLDAQNAKLRSSNNEAKILILEKKVEQLQLLVNKLQLQG